MTPFTDSLGADEGADIARRIRAGDRAAEATLARCYCDCVFSMVLARTHDRASARELVDDILMAVILALRNGAVRDCRHLGGFVHGTAVNKINGYFRKRRRLPRAVRLGPYLPAAAARDDVEALERRKTVRDAMARLHGRDRRILYLTLTEGLKPGEIAARLGVSPALVRQRKCRALRAIVLEVAGG